MADLDIEYHERASVKHHTARELAARLRAGESKTEVMSGRPPDVKREVARILADSTLDIPAQRQLRRAKITELIVDADPKVAAAGIALSQKEDPVQPVQQHNIGWMGHWGNAPDGGVLEAGEVVDAESE